MKEDEYIKVTNRVNITRAKDALRDVLSGDNYGISKQELSDIDLALRRIEDRLFNLIEVTES